jgi:hypothetical protein
MFSAAASILRKGAPGACPDAFTQVPVNGHGGYTEEVEHIFGFPGGIDPAVVSPIPGIDVSESRRRLRSGWSSKVLANRPFNLRDLFIERRDDFPNRGRNDGRVR